MRVRTYGLILLGLAGIAPLAIYGGQAIHQSRSASEKQVCESQDILARVILDRLVSYAEIEGKLLRGMGIGILLAKGDRLSTKPYQLENWSRQFRYIAVYEKPGDAATADGDTPTGAVFVTGEIPPGRADQYRQMADAVLADRRSRYSRIELVDLQEGQGPGHILTMAEPIEIVGQLRGVIVATYDLIGLWHPVNKQRIANTGYVALVSAEGDLLAHGNSEMRRDILTTKPEVQQRVRRYYRQLLGRAEDCLSSDELVVSTATGTLFGPGRHPANHRTARPRAASAPPPPDVDSTGWLPRIDLHVLVEQSADEAFASTRAMIRNLAFVGLGVVLFVVCAGLAIGRVLVRALERLGVHALELGEHLDDSHPAPRSRLVEVRTLAEQLDAMATNLVKERDAARARERLATFARVAAGLAHDLRLPVETVLGACEQVIARPDDAGARHILGKVSTRELRRLKRYVDDLQRLAREGDLGLEYDHVDPAALVRDIRDELADNPKWGGVEFVARGEPGMAVLDPNLIRRAVINLAGNAADACLEKLSHHAAAGGVAPDHRVIIELADAGDDQYLDIRVVDPGPGIPPEQLAMLEKGDFQSTKRSTGVGLGLGVVKQIAAAHGGALTMSSRVGEGSTFTLHLPRDRCKADKSPI